MASRERTCKGTKVLGIFVCTALVALLASSLVVSGCSAQQGAKPPGKLIPLTVGNQWTYRVRIPKDVHLIFAPHFVYPDYVIVTSATQGVLARARGPEEATFTIKCVQALSDSSCKAQVDEAGLGLWFNNRITEERLVLLPQESFLALELHAVTEIDKDKGDPWILGQVLALVPAQSGQDRVEVSGWSVEALSGPVQVPAGEFSKGFHSVIRKPGPAFGQSGPPAHTIESWTAAGVGLVKYVMKGPDDNVLFSLELASYAVK